MIALLAAAALAVAPPAQLAPLSEADHAIASGRLDQARIMIGEAVQAGVHGPQLDRLLADLAFASRDFVTALIRYEALLAIQPDEPLFAERIGIAAIHQGDLTKAASALTLATAVRSASWRAWNARGVLADLRGNWADADRSYARATSANPNASEVRNNQAWSLLLRGQWQGGLALLEQAAALDPHVTRIANNLELARTAVSEHLPQRRADESASNWAARLNDAGVVAGLRGHRKQAIAAFAQAIMANNVWFERAANNLALAEADK